MPHVKIDLSQFDSKQLMSCRYAIERELIKRASKWINGVFRPFRKMGFKVESRLPEYISYYGDDDIDNIEVSATKNNIMIRAVSDCVKHIPPCLELMIDDEYLGETYDISKLIKIINELESGIWSGWIIKKARDSNLINIRCADNRITSCTHAIIDHNRVKLRVDFIRNLNSIDCSIDNELNIFGAKWNTYLCRHTLLPRLSSLTIGSIDQSGAIRKESIDGPHIKPILLAGNDHRPYIFAFDQDLKIATAVVVNYYNGDIWPTNMRIKISKSTAFNVKRLFNTMIG